MKIKLNRNGSGVFQRKSAARIAAFTYTVPSRSDPDLEHRVYVERILPHPIARCQCDCFLFNGRCGHVELCIVLEKRYIEKHPETYNQERKRQRIHKRNVHINPV